MKKNIIKIVIGASGIFFLICSCGQTETESAHYKVNNDCVISKKTSSNVNETEIIESDSILKKNAVRDLLAFYRKYISINSKMPVDRDELDKLKQEICTPKCIQWIQDSEFDYDPFLNSQDCNMEWLNSLKVKCIQKYDDAVFEVSYYDSGSNQSNRLRLFPFFQNDSVKIDSIAW